MSIVVQKYGGSSLADVSRLGLVVDQVVERQRGGTRVVVVVSAMGKTTDELLDKARQVTSVPSRRELDMLLTAGERISMALLSMALHERDIRAISFTGSQSGIITEDSHQGARIIEIRPERIEQALDDEAVVIVAGYQGVSLKREVTTLGRGGSDTTAIALAAALGAECCEIYSDVDGVYSADPRVCAQAQLIPHIEYQLMQTMSEAGARVLNLDAVEYARRAGIKIVARRTGCKSGRQTEVSGVRPSLPDKVIAVVGVPSLSRFHGAEGDLGRLVSRVQALGGRVVVAVQTPYIDMIVNCDDIPFEDRELMVAVARDEKIRYDELAMVTLVARGGASGVCERALRLLTDEGYVIEQVWLRDHAIHIGIDSALCNGAVDILHQEFIG